MKFTDLIGQEHAVKLIKQSMSKNRLAHAYLFAGPDGVGKKTCAQIFARTLNCLEGGNEPCNSCISCTKEFHPDIHLIKPKGTSLRIEQMRELQNNVVYKPYEGKWKVYILEDADKLTEAAANSLLKTLEEPPPVTVFILITSQVEKILPTIRSRCQQINFRPIGQEKISAFLKEHYPQMEEEKRDLAASLAEGSPGRACTLLEDEDAFSRMEEVRQIYRIIGEDDLAPFTIAKKWKDRKDELGDFFQILTLLYRRSLWQNIEGSKDELAKVERALATIGQTEAALARNANVQLALEQLLLSLAKEREETLEAKSSWYQI
jgi:DNA polymerase-3 subunit delta'